MKSDKSITADGVRTVAKLSNAEIGILKRKLRKQAKDKFSYHLPEGAKVGFMNDTPPKAGMHYEISLMAWVPDSFDKEAFQKEKENAIEAEYQRLLDITPNPNNPQLSLSGKKLQAEDSEDSGKATSKQDNANEDMDSKTLVEQYPVAPAIPHVDEEVEVAIIPGKPSQTKPSPDEELQLLTKTETLESDEKSDAETPVTLYSTPTAETVEQSKKTRRSAKMVEADFDSLAARFIAPTDLKEKKPLFFPEELREALRLIAGLVPGGKVSPSHIAIHVLQAWIDDNRDVLNRMLANRKTSI